MLTLKHVYHEKAINNLKWKCQYIMSEKSLTNSIYFEFVILAISLNFQKTRFKFQ